LALGGLGALAVVSVPILLSSCPEIRAATEQVMVFQALELDADFVIPSPEPNATRHEAFFPRDAIYWTVNGQTAPVITMRRGEVQRWRMLNAAEGKLMSLQLTGHELHHIGYDGLAIPAPRHNRRLVDWPEQYYAKNLEHLIDVKTAWDPDNLFTSAQTIAPRYSS